MMSPTIETRVLITLSAGGSCVRGTYHRSQNHGSGVQVDLPEENRTGILLINPGFLPRSGDGDSAVYWADSFAKCGYPAFRVDLPGLGDSDGEIPENFLHFINTGKYVPVVSGIVKQLVERYGLSGVVVMGICAGAVTALHAAAASERCKGVVLLDPYFFLPPARTQIRNELSKLAASSSIAGLTADIYDYFRYLRLLVRRKRLPANANVPLLRCWKQIISRGASVLILKAPSYKAPSGKPRVGEFDYLSYLQKSSGSRARIAVKFIEGTNHSFADVTGKAAVRQHVEQWLNASFRSTEFESAAVSADSEPPKSGLIRRYVYSVRGDNSIRAGR